MDSYWVFTAVEMLLVLLEGSRVEPGCEFPTGMVCRPSVFGQNLRTKPRMMMELWANHGYHFICFPLLCKGPCTGQGGFSSLWWLVGAVKREFLNWIWLTWWTP